VALLALPFAVSDYSRTLMAEIFIFAIFAMSLDLLLGFTGLMSLGHAAFFGLGAYAVAVMGTMFGINAWIGVAAGIALAAVAVLLKFKKLPEPLIVAAGAALGLLLFPLTHRF